MIPAIILAAGASSRMGRTKALLPLPEGDVFLARIAGTLRRAGIENIVAVIGHDVDRIRAAAAEWEEGPTREGVRIDDHRGPVPLRLAVNPSPERGQLSSLLIGLDAVLAQPRSREVSAVLVTTVDLPLVSVGTVGRVLKEWRRSRAPIVRPARGTRHGHPVVFSAAVFEELRAADLRVGARAVVQAHLDEIVDVVVDDPGAFEDIDTPEDYRRLVRRE